MSKKSGIFTSAAAAALSIALTSAPSHADQIHRRARHQDQHQSLLRQDEGGLRGQGQGTRPDAAGLRRQVRRRQRRRGRGDRATDRGRRQGHPAGAERFDRDRADGREGPQGRHSRHHARHAARSDRRRRRQFRHRQFQGRRTDRPVGEGDARRQGRDAPRSPRSISPPTSRPSTICATTASSPASASRSRIPSTTRRATARRSSAPT